MSLNLSQVSAGRCDTSCNNDAEKSECDLAYKTKMMSEDSNVNVNSESFKAYFLMRIREIVKTTKYKDDE